jgi:hypothetical protein
MWFEYFITQTNVCLLIEKQICCENYINCNSTLLLKTSLVSLVIPTQSECGIE